MPSLSATGGGREREGVRGEREGERGERGKRGEREGVRDRERGGGVG